MAHISSCQDARCPIPQLFCVLWIAKKHRFLQSEVGPIIRQIERCTKHWGAQRVQQFIDWSTSVTWVKSQKYCYLPPVWPALSSDWTPVRFECITIFCLPTPIPSSIASKLVYNAYGCTVLCKVPIQASVEKKLYQLAISCSRNQVLMPLY